MGSAIFSEDRKFRYRLDRDVQEHGAVFAYFGVNGATAGEVEEDHTTMKWRGFTLRNYGRKYIAGNPFAYCATDVKELAAVDDPIGPDNAHHLAQIIADADILVPCWGDRGKLPRRLRHHLVDLKTMIFDAGKPVLIFGLTNAGDPKHPLMLGYDTPLMPWWR